MGYLAVIVLDQASGCPHRKGIEDQFPCPAAALQVMCRLNITNPILFRNLSGTAVLQALIRIDLLAARLYA
ncbi:MAG: hypothetical protein CMQ69_00260 [Gammaproteobacteria bacterium]|nr:hypothetical protein [Gammaproteobacteria bacterium]